MKIPESTIRRLAKYYRLLERIILKGVQHISSDEIGNLEGLTSAQVRKDLSFFGSFGRRGLGYDTRLLNKQIGQILGIHRTWNVVVLGAGSMGSALLHYPELGHHGFIIKVIMDNSPEKIGQPIGPLTVADIRYMEEIFRNEKIEIAMIAIPSDAAQVVTDQVVKTGIKAILNFAPRKLDVPEDVIVRQADIAIEMEVLTYYINQRNKQRSTGVLSNHEG
jgi:redox-sensing transcriptional repressor